MPRPNYLAFKLILAATLNATTFTSFTGAQEPPAANEVQRLRAVELELQKSEAERNRLQRRQEAATRELESLRSSAVNLAKEIQDQEYSLTVLESRLGDLEKQEQTLRSTLGLRDEQMQRVAMALQRMALRPTDAVTLSPLSPGDSVRTAILLRSAIPAVRDSALALEGELGELYRVRSDLQEQQGRVAVAAASLIDKRNALEVLEQDKTRLHLELSTANAQATERVQKLASEAADLKELVTKLAVDRARREEERRLAEAQQQKATELVEEQPAKSDRIVLKPPPGVAPEPQPAQNQAQVAALAPNPNKASSKPSDLRAFSEAKGTMPYPVVGSLTRRYGEGSEDPGALSKGVVISARSAGQVIAPFDGVVAFAGPFRGYGLLLIIEHSEGYHTLLAGLGRIDCVLDQRVFAGEPVGVMTNDTGNELYVELRQNGQPVNPLPWLASRTGKSNG
ncbi:MAG: peptidase M23 [Rhodospirillaceae bacterium]|nr:peptidase M23 [Rhodospirillaceae bacterium]